MRITKGRALMHRRKRLGLAQKDLAELLGWPASSLCKLESGKAEQANDRFEAAHAELDTIEAAHVILDRTERAKG